MGKRGDGIFSEPSSNDSAIVILSTDSRFGSHVLITGPVGRRKWVVTLVLLLLGVCGYLGTSLFSPPLQAPLLDGSTTTVVPGVHLIGGLGPAAAYVVETSDGLVLIDTGLESDAQRLKSEMGRLRLDWKRLRAIFLTHVHGDHCGGAERLRGETGARVHAGQEEVSILAAGKPRDAFFSTFKMPGHAPHPTTVDVPLRGGETLTFGEVQFQVLNTPGHTTGSTCFLMQRRGRRILFSGDVIFRLGDKPLGTYSAYLAPRYRGDVNQYLGTLQKLNEIPVPDLVLPGHPNASRVPKSPQLTSLEWSEMLSRGIDEMQQLSARFAAEGANFLDDRPKPLLHDFYYLGDFQGSCVYVLRANTEFFAIDAPGGIGLGEFIQRKLGELGHPLAALSGVLLTAVGPRETAGLNDLIQQNPRIQIVAAEGGLELIQRISPAGTTLLSAEKLPQTGWFPVSMITLQSGGIWPVAYVIQWEGKTVLASGRIPLMIDQQSRAEIAELLPGSRREAFDFVSAVRKLVDLNPNLWLPAASINSQNANLYEGIWKGILDRNYRMATEVLQSR